MSLFFCGERDRNGKLLDVGAVAQCFEQHGGPRRRLDIGPSTSAKRRLCRRPDRPPQPLGGQERREQVRKTSTHGRLARRAIKEIGERPRRHPKSRMFSMVMPLASSPRRKSDECRNDLAGLDDAAWGLCAAISAIASWSVPALALAGDDLVDVAAHQLGLHPGRTDHDAGDAMRRAFERHAARQAQQAGLSSAVGRIVLPADAGGRRA